MQRSRRVSPAVSWVVCLREVIPLAMSLVYLLVIPQYKVLPQLCTAVAQKHGRAAHGDTLTGIWYNQPPAGRTRFSLLCQAGRRAPGLRQGISVVVAAYLKGITYQLWLQLVVVGDWAVAAHLLLVATYATTTALLVWRNLRPPTTTPVGAMHSHLIFNVGIRLLTAAGNVGVYLSSGTARHHVLEALLRDGQRLQLFASLAWLDGWLSPLPLMWQVPLGLVEYVAFTATCDWYAVLAGRPAPSWQQHLLELFIAVVVPTVYIWYYSSLRIFQKAAPEMLGAAADSSGPLQKLGKPTGSKGSSSSSSSFQGIELDSSNMPVSAKQPPASDRLSTAAVPQQQQGQQLQQSVQAVPFLASLLSEPADGISGGWAPAMGHMFAYKPATALIAFSVKVATADFDTTAPACKAAAHQALCSTDQQQLLPYITAVPGCVLLLGQVVVPTAKHPAAEARQVSTCNGHYSSCHRAFDGRAWTVELPLPAPCSELDNAADPAQAQGYCPSLSYGTLQELQQAAAEGQLLSALAAASPASSHLQLAAPKGTAVVKEIAAATPEEAAAAAMPEEIAPAPPLPTPPPGPHRFCAVGSWGQPVALQLLLPSGYVTTGSSGCTTTSGVLPYDRIRAVLTRGSAVVVDRTLPLTAVAVAADGSARVHLELQPPPDSRNTPAAAFCLYLLPQQTPPTGPVASQQPLAQVTLLMLEQPVAAELVPCVALAGLTVCQLSLLLGDLAVLLDTRQQLQAVWVHRHPPPANADTAAAALARVHLAVAAADHLGPYLSGSGLPLAADLVAGVKQQVLVGAARLQPPAAGRVGPEQADAAAPAAMEGSSSMQHQPQPDTAAATDPAAATGRDPDHGTSRAPAWQVHLLHVSSMGTAPFAPSRLAPGSDPLPQQLTWAATSKDSSSSDAAQTPGGAASSSKAALPVNDNNSHPCKGKGSADGADEAADAELLAVTAAERQAVAYGGWQGALLCWRGFSCPGTEQAYLLFKSDHLWVWDWVCLVYYLVAVLLSMSRFLKVTGQSLWPPHRVFGTHGLAEAIARMLVMLLARSSWRRQRQTHVLEYFFRLPFWLLWEAYMWPVDVLTAIRGGVSKLLLTMPVHLVIALAVPKVMLKIWSFLAPLGLLLTLVHATSDEVGVGGWIYQWRCTGGTPLLLYCLGYTLVSLAITLCMSVVTDLWGRQAFLKSQQKEKKRQQLA